MSFPLGMGTTLVHFHILGSVLFLIQMLKSLVTERLNELLLQHTGRNDHLHDTESHLDIGQDPQGTCQGLIWLEEVVGH